MAPPRRRFLPALVATASLVASLAGSIAGSIAVAGPASADVTGTTSSHDLVLYRHCQRHPISYDLGIGPGTSVWSVEIQVSDPNGIGSEGTVLSSSTGSPVSGTVYQTFCGSEPAGTYTVRATGFYEVLPALRLPIALPETTFEARPAATRTTLRKKALGHGRYQLTSRVMALTERGFHRSNGITVRIERLVHGQWRTFRGTTLTTVHGMAGATVHAGPGTKVRAVVPPRNNYAGSTSRVVRL